MHEIKVPPESNIFNTEIILVRYNTTNLIPHKKVPVAIFVCLNGMYQEILQKDQIIDLDFLNNLVTSSCFFFYIQKKEQPVFDNWIQSRHNFENITLLHLDDDLKKIQHKITEYLLQSSQFVKLKDDSLTSQNLHSLAKEQFQKIVTQEKNVWFFEADLSKAILSHSGRVTFSMILFLMTRKELLKIIDLENLIQFSMIHELKGDPADFQSKNIGEESFEYLKEKNVPVSSKVGQWLKNHEIFKESEKEIDNQYELQVFSLFNYLDHYRVMNRDKTTSVAIKESLKSVKEKEKLFAPKLFEVFEEFVGLLVFNK